MEFENEFKTVIDILNRRHPLYTRRSNVYSLWDEWYVYVIEFEDKIKIGRSEQPKKRIKTLQSTNKQKVLNSYITPCINFHKLFEKKCHEEFIEDNITWEYFKWDFSNIVKIIKWLQENFIESAMFVQYREEIPRLKELITELEEEITDLDNRFKTRVNKLSYECMKDWLFKEIRKNLTKEQIIKLLSD